MNEVLFIDNHDSFSYNLIDYCSYLGMRVLVYENDKLCIPYIERLNPSHIIISPGPHSPEQSGISLAVIAHFWPHKPILGVCLGHQCLAYQFGGNIIRATKPVHGYVERLIHKQQGLFQNIPIDMQVTRYHSLLVDADKLPAEFLVDAYSQKGEIMAIRHQQKPLYGLQFHPEALLTEYGMLLLRNFFFANIQADKV